MPFNFLVIPAIIIATAYYSTKYAKSGLKPWYIGLRKPSGTPTGKLIREIWTFLYVITTLGVMWYWNVPVAGWLKYIVGSLLLTNAYYHLNWNKVFFREHDMAKSLQVIQYMNITGITATVLMTIHDPISACLMLPYIAWVSYATKLNRELLELNPQQTKNHKNKVINESQLDRTND